MVFTIGCDPEVFVRENGKPISAHGLIPGNKKEPFKTANGAVQVDGMALEFNTDPVDLNDFEGFNLNVLRTKADLKNLLSQKGVADGKRYNLAEIPVQEFDLDYINSQPDEAKELGCDPDWNAYTLLPNPMPVGDRPFRTGAGHIHVGWGADIPIDNEDHLQICANFVKTMDCTVGLFMTFIDRETRRRELYGKAGAFRPKPYGVEYRTPSNMWIRNKNRRFLIHNLVKRAVDFQSSSNSIETLIGIYSQENVREIIDNGLHVQAGEILSARFAKAGKTVRDTWTSILLEMEKEEADAKK